LTPIWGGILPNWGPALEDIKPHRSDLLVTLRTASRELGRDGVRAVVHSLTQQSLPEAFREASFRYLSAGRENKAEGLTETLIRQLKRRFHLSASELTRVREVTDIAKLQAALDEIIEPEATCESVLGKLG